MCMKYINATTRCYKSITVVDNNVMSYNIPFTSIRHDNDETGITISKFSIVTNIDFLGTLNENNKKENPLDNKDTLDFIIRLTKCSSEESKRIGYDLDCFSIDLNEMYATNQIGKACFDFLNYTRTTKVDELELPGGVGKYVIKILVKKAKEKEYTIQSMTQFIVV